MSGIADTVTGLTKKLGTYALQALSQTKACAVRFMKVKMHCCKKCSARKKMDQATSRLGAEIYALHKQEESNWDQFPQVQQQLKLVEDAETAVLAVDMLVDEINEDYQAKKQAIKDKYAAIRAGAGQRDDG